MVPRNPLAGVMAPFSAALRLLGMTQTQASPEDMFLRNLSAIDGIARAAARRRRLTPDETEEFRSIVRLRLIEDDYAIIREFRGSSSFRTFLTVVIARQCLDYRAASWGRWRASSRARRLGDTAVTLERLMARDGLPFERAAASIRETEPTVTNERLRDLVVQLPPRVKRIRVSEEMLADCCADTPAPDAGVAMREGRRVVGALARALTTLDPIDRRIMKLRFTDGLSVVGIARHEGLEQASLYRRVERILRRLRREIEERGIEASEVRTHLLSCR
jgi:DNA-directed RNA polymerase specialized sigma24 family protein